MEEEARSPRYGIACNKNSRRAFYKKKYKLDDRRSSGDKAKLRPAFIAQLDGCKDEAARRLILGISR